MIVLDKKFINRKIEIIKKDEKATFDGFLGDKTQMEHFRLIKEELKRKFPTSFVIDSKDASPWEALAIMTRGSRLIAANSTLSWWACVIAKHRNIEIYGPSIWMQENLGMNGINYSDTVFEN